jgi:hypothetical protein
MPSANYLLKVINASQNITANFFTLGVLHKIVNFNVILMIM